MNNHQSLAEMLSQFFASYFHAIYAFVMTFIISVFRICYLHKENNKRRVIIEGILCGLLAVASRYVFIHLNMTEDLSVAFGAVVGLTGVDKVREIGMNFLNNKSRK